jgi:histidinol-phosphatase
VIGPEGLAATEDLALALHLADVADAITMASFGQNVEWRRKGDGTPVTSVDQGVEAALVQQIEAARPYDDVLGEESSDPSAPDCRGRPSRRRWVIDPIDQTRHFLRGNPEFATLISLTVDEEPVLGVVSAPALRARWWARRGAGAWKQGMPIRVSSTQEIGAAYVSVAGHLEWQGPRGRGVRELLRRCSYATASAGGFLSHMLVAEGAGDICIEPWGRLWDHLASAVIVQEAGGVATTLSGGPVSGGSFLATNALLREEAQTVLRSDPQ